jgi:hypothetical protein
VHALHARRARQPPHPALRGHQAILLQLPQDPLDAAPVLLLLIDLPDLLRQFRVTDRMRRRPAVPPRVISGPAHTEHPAHEIHREAHPARQALILLLHLADEGEPQRF